MTALVTAGGIAVWVCLVAVIVLAVIVIGGRNR